uniref:Uncharacterized protein n=1 Tax=Amphimedon queenslandica TaxID=400682 RepID=A0A1X7TRG2_AMPQE
DFSNFSEPSHEGGLKPPQPPPLDTPLRSCTCCDYYMLLCIWHS